MGFLVRLVFFVSLVFGFRLAYGGEFVFGGPIDGAEFRATIHEAMVNGSQSRPVELANVGQSRLSL